MATRVIGYWGTTILLVFLILTGGVAEVAHAWGTLETVTILGYPPYFLTILGVWKILGAIALLAPRFPRLKEWTYAGIVFGMTGAAVSHMMSSDFGPYAFHLIVPLSLAGLAIVSWALRPQSRTLGLLSPAAPRASSATVGSKRAPWSA